MSSDNVPVDQMRNLGLGSNTSERVICGPLLRYIGIDYARGIYRASCLIVATDRQPPPLVIRTSIQQQPFHAQGELLDVFRDTYHFWRYEIHLPLAKDRGQEVTYSWGDPNGVGPFTFHVPALLESMRFMFYSCSGFSDIPQEEKDKFGEMPLWEDVLDRHAVAPFHVLLGGGDQLYQDRLMKEDFMKPWREEPSPKKRLAMELPPAMKEGFEHFFFWNYIQNFA